MAQRKEDKVKVVWEIFLQVLNLKASGKGEKQKMQAVLGKDKQG